MAGTWIRLAAPIVHRCPLPGWRERRKVGAQLGAIWKCDCGRGWKWTLHSYMDGDEKRWELISGPQPEKHDIH